jgi:hypothetical protein
VRNDSGMAAENFAGDSQALGSRVRRSVSCLVLNRLGTFRTTNLTESAMAEKGLNQTCQFCAIAFIFSAQLVFPRPLDMIDHKNRHGSCLCFQLQAKLLLNRRED